MALLIFSCSCNKQAKTPEAIVPARALNAQGVGLASYMLKDDIDTLAVGQPALIQPDHALQLLHLDFIVSAKKYEADYEANEIAADKKYKSKKIVIYGKVVSINKDALGDGFITLLSDQPIGVQAFLSGEGSDGAADVQKSKTISLVCDPGGRTLGLESARNCVLFSQYLAHLHPNFDDIVTGVLTGRLAIPKDIAEAITFGYVIGTDLPSDSKCVSVSHEGCEEAMAKMEKAQIGAQVTKELQFVKTN